MRGASDRQDGKVALYRRARAASTTTQTMKSKRGSTNMRAIRVKGLNWSTYKLADGTKKTKYYAWRGGPLLVGELGSPEFWASYNAAVASRVVAPEGRLLSLTQAYQRSQQFLSLRERTRADYIKQIAKIEQKFGDAPIKALADPRTRGIFMDWRDELALKSQRQADYAMQVLALILAWAKDRGKITVNPCERPGRVYHGTRVDQVWSVEDEAAFLKFAPPHLHLPLLLALWTGQRQGDLLRLPWSAYDGTHIRLRQSKTGARVEVPVGAPLKAALDAAQETRPADPSEQSGTPVDLARLSSVVGHRRDEGRHRWSHVQRFTRHRRHATRLGRLHRGADRRHHRPQSARCVLDPRRALSAPRSGVGTRCDQQVGNGRREGGEGCGMTNSDDTRLDAIFDDARAGRITPEAAFAAIEADPAIYKAAKTRMLRAAMRDVI